MSTVKIASIYFAPVKEDLSTFGFGTYAMPAVKFGDAPAIIEITDRVQHDKGPYNGGRQRQPMSYQHSGESIASSLLNAWTALGQGMTPDSHPGLWIVREKMPLMTVERRLESGQVVPADQERDTEGKAIWRDATPEEKKAMWAEDLATAQSAQRRFAEYLFMQANIMAEKPAFIQFIPRHTREAAVYYSRTFEWMKEGAISEENITCPWCATRISPKAVVCPAASCGNIVNPKRYAELKKQTEADVEEAMTAPEPAKIPTPRRSALGLQPVVA